MYYLRYTRGLGVSSLRGYRSVLSAVFRFHLPSLSSDFVPLLPTLFSGVCATSPTWDLSMVLTYLVSPAFEPLSQASFRALPLTTLFLMALATAKMSWGATGSLFHSHLCGWGCLPFLHPAVCRQVGVAHPFHPSLLLGDVLSRLCGWSWFRPPTMPGQGSPLVSASGQVFVSRSPSPFRVPSAPCSPFSTNAVSFFLGGGHSCCSGGWTSGWIPLGSRSPQRVHLCRVPPSLVGYLCPWVSHLGLQFGVFFI